MKKIVILLSCLLLVFCVTACGNSEIKEVEEKDMTENIIESGNYIVLDVRTASEYNTSHVKDSINIPYDEIDENIDLDKDKTIFVYCQSGKRSAIAYDTLTKLGYNVIDLGAYSNVPFEKE
jgi:rhodanese-related sulfurtransferase